MPNGKIAHWNHNSYTYIGDANNQPIQFANYAEISTINNTEIPGIKSRLSSLENVHEIGSTVPQTLAVGHIYFQIPTE